MAIVPGPHHKSANGLQIIGQECLSIGILRTRHVAKLRRLGRFSGGGELLLVNVLACCNHKQRHRFENGGTKQCCQRSKKNFCFVFTPACDIMGYISTSEMKLTKICQISLLGDWGQEGSLQAVGQMPLPSYGLENDRPNILSRPATIHC